VSKREQILSDRDTLAILADGEMGVLSTVDASGQPYGVPLNYYYDAAENALFAHCLIRGKKLDNLRANPLVSFAVVGEYVLEPERFSSRYRSAIVTGRATIIEDPDEKTLRLTHLNERLAPLEFARYEEAIQRSLSSTSIIKIDIDSATGKVNPAPKAQNG